jgi:hypothetical protein
VKKLAEDDTREAIIKIHFESLRDKMVKKYNHLNRKNVTQNNKFKCKNNIKFEHIKYRLTQRCFIRNQII